MRKTLIALMLVLPMVFMLVIYSSVNWVSLGVNISVNGIRILAEGRDDEGTLFLNMADKTQHYVTAEVLPNNATEKGYTLSSSDADVADVTAEGRIVPKKEGTAEITATSNDKSFTDTMSVVVVSSMPYDFTFALFDGAGENVLEATEDGYRGKIQPGTYRYEIVIAPTGFNEYTLTAGAGTYAQIEKGRKEILLPFSGEAELEVAVEGIDGPIRKQVQLTVEKADADAVLINGCDSAEFTGLQLAYGTTEVQLYLECNGNFSDFTSPHAHLKGDDENPLSRPHPTNLKNGRYILDIVIDDGVQESFNVEIVAGKKTIRLVFTFTAFDFTVFSDMNMEQTEDGGSVTLLTGAAATFYAVSSGGAKGVEYTWKFSGPADYLKAEGDTATIKAVVGGQQYTLSVTAKYGDTVLTKTVVLDVINNISAIQISSTKVDLAMYYTIAGMVYTDDLTTAQNVYPLRVSTWTTSGKEEAGSDVEYSVSDTSVAEVEIRDGKPVIVPKETGNVTVTAAWKGDKKVAGTLTVNVVKDAVAVKNAPELVHAADMGVPVVLTEDIHLGTDAAGTPFTPEQRNEYLKAHRFKSTYNIEWYKHNSGTALPYTEKDAYLSYVMEFKNNVYGNGKSIDADNFTHAIDGTGNPILDLYQGPLYFVNYNKTASVAGQDNCAFLIRTDGVKLYGVNLLGCLNSSLENADGIYDLSNLNKTGTTLEINASCEIINCRVSNGRNVVRVYGGNRNGEKYFIDSLPENTAGVDSERINVKIDGCILSQGREFILKIGTNRALRASLINGQEPALRDKSGNAYKEDGKTNRYGDGKLYEDPYFYSQYVLTDVTLKDSVIETSGLFTVGIESNFAGEFLYPGGESYRGLTTDWEYSGGTSFAAVLRVVGDVRLYDWKDLSHIDTSTLIESGGSGNPLSGILKLDLQKMLDFAAAKFPALYGDLIQSADNQKFVHGGIALYGGGRNYSTVDLSALKAYNGDKLNDFTHVNVNIGILSQSDGTMGEQGALLPRAAGTHDFNFYMYGKNSAMDYAKQEGDKLKGLKYKGVAAVPLFADKVSGK